MVEHSLGKGEVTSSILVIGSRVYSYTMTQIFQKAQIAIENPEAFGALQSTIERVFAPVRVERLMKRLEKRGVSIRNFEDVLNKGVLEQVDETLSSSGKSARTLYDVLTVSDQAQLRELYLTALESIEPSLREKYAKIYRYY